MTRIAGTTVLVTGGATGIGLLTGRHLLAQGASRLVIWDADAPALESACAELRAGHRVDGMLVDVRDLPSVQRALGELRTRGVAVDILVNNAGVVVGKAFAAHSHDDVRLTMETNALAPMHVTLEVLPGMLERRAGHIVNISSSAAMLANPRMSVYCGSKWALTGWSESLRLEMERSRSGVRVTTVMPYYVDTGMFAGVRSLIPLLEPDHVAREIASAIRDDRIVLRLPWWLNLLPFVRGLLPARWFDRIVGEWLGVYRSMDTFTGRVRTP